MQIYSNNKVYGGVLALWGALALGSIVTGGKYLNKQMHKEGQIAEIYNNKIDSIKSQIKQEMPLEADKCIEKLGRRITGDYPNVKYISWERALDSLRVQQLGEKAIMEFNNKLAPTAYKAAKDSLKIIR